MHPPQRLSGGLRRSSAHRIRPSEEAPGQGMEDRRATGLDLGGRREDTLMKEIRIHGRGGQGSVVTAEILAVAAFEDGKFSQAFPYLGGGGDRRGAPVQAFLRISDAPIRLRSKIHEPDYVIVQDPTLVKEVEVGKGLKPGGLLIINSERDPADLGLAAGIRAVAVPASRIALEVIGRPIMNTALMGAFSAISQEVSLPAVLRAIRVKFPGEVGEKNAQAAQRMYEMLKGKEGA